MLLIHISDIHFRKGEIGSTMDPNLHLRNELLQDAEQMCIRIGGVPEAIIVSGDIAFASNPEEYAFALEWLETLAVKCGTSLESVFIVPGNHDIDRNLAAKPLIQSLHNNIKATSLENIDGMLRGLIADAESSRVLFKPLDHYNHFAMQFFCDVKGPDRTIAKRELLLNDGSILMLQGLNSAFVSNRSDQCGSLLVDPACCQITKKRGIEHVAICHHPFEWLKNGSALKDHLNDVARIQLFGHMHTNRIELNRDHVRIFASAAHPDRSEHGWEPGYNLIELNVINSELKRELIISTHVRIWQSRPGQFRAKMDGAEDVFQHKLRLDNWHPPQVKSEIEDKGIQSTDLESSSQTIDTQEAGSDPMDSLRKISLRFFKLNLSQKSAIAGKLGLIEEEDLNQPDFERFRRVLIRAKKRNLIEELDKEVSAASIDNN